MNKIIALFILILSSGVTYAQCGGSDVGGVVFMDIPSDGVLANTYGTKETNEQGLPGITITVIDNNQVVHTTTTDSIGQWVVTSPAFPVRVEYAWANDWIKSSPFGTNGNATIRQILSNNCAVDLAVFRPNEYLHTPTPKYVSHIRITGSSIGSTISSLETVNYLDSLLSSNFNNSMGVTGLGVTPTTDATFQEIGAVWGKGYQASKERMFLSSVLWRHVGFADTKGPGDIFVIDYSVSPGNVLGSFDLQGVTPQNGGANIDLGDVCRGGGCESVGGNTGILADYELSANVNTPSVDLDAFAKTGKVSYGGISVDVNSDKVWVVNLYQQAIIEIDATGDLNTLTGNVNQYLINSLPNVPTCTGGSLRPWALKVRDGKGYLGCVCDGLTSQAPTDMDAYVLSFDLANPSAGFTSIFSMGLDYNKNGQDWQAWSDVDLSTGSNWTRYPQPILSDIEFDELGNMYLAFMDRWGVQAGFNQHPPTSGAVATSEKAQTSGELFKICNTYGAFELEGTGSCPTNYPVTSEFFNDKAGDNHAEGAGGAIALVPGSNQLLVQIVDPHPEGLTGQAYWSTQGMNTLSTLDGSIENWYSNIYSGNPAYNGKGVGMGDVEFLTEPAPIEIGNLVWNDANANGVQDPGEAGIQNVTVALLDDTDAVLTSAVTDANGHFIFSNASGTSTASHIFNVNNFDFGSNYKLRITNAIGGSQQGALVNLLLVQNDTGQGSNANLNDSDATLTGNNALIDIMDTDIPSMGANNHSFDFGFRATPQIDWGDLPDLAAGTAAGDYETLSANGGPSHTLGSDIMLGSAVTGEADGLQDVGANGDADDGVTGNMNMHIYSGTTLNFPFTSTNTTGATGYLEGWIDWNGNGDFEVSEQVVDLNDAVSFPSYLTITIPQNAVKEQSIGMRFRISTTDNMTPYGVIGDGEVEDYMMIITCPASVCLPLTGVKH